MWTKSACVVLAWSILLAVGMEESVRPAQANIRIASSTTQVTLASTLSVAAPRRTAARPATRYVVRPGDTLSGIAARFAVRGGWPALYAANRPLIGPDPDLVRAGTVLRVSGQARVPTPAPAPGRRLYRAPPSASAGTGHRPVTERTGTPAVAGMPRWLETLLAAAGLLIGAAYLVEPLLAARRRRRPAAGAAAPPALAGKSPLVSPQRPSGEPGGGQPPAGRARIVVADHDRVVVTYSQRDGMVCVLRPPGCDPGEVLRAARLVLPEEPYGELARQLGLPGAGRGGIFPRALGPSE